MGKQWVRQQIRRDEVQDVIGKGLQWVQRNRELAAKVSGGTALAVLVAGIAIYRAFSVQAAAWDRLALAQSYAYSGQADSGLQQIKDLLSDYPSSRAAGYARLFEGDILFQKGQYKEAAQAYQPLAEEPSKLQPIALGDAAVSLEAAGQCQQALQQTQRFLENYPDHFMAPQVHSCQARCLEALGQNDQAKAAYQKIALQYPDTSWAVAAKAKVEAPPAK